jgi:hypothetical protein
VHVWHDEIVQPSGLLVLRLPRETLILDPEPRFRCRECDAKGTAVVMVKVGLVQHLARGTQMAASSEPMITEAARRFPCRIKIGVPIRGLGTRLTEMYPWLDENCGADGWAMTPAGQRGVVNGAVAIYFLRAMSCSGSSR